MAVTFPKGDVTSGTAATKEITVSATSGNYLVVFIAVSGSTAEPKIKDDKDNETGWFIHATAAKANATKGAVWCAKKLAKGTETLVTAEPAGAGTVQGLAYAEMAGSNGELDSLTNYDNLDATTVKEHTTAAYTTTDANGGMLIGFSQCGAATMGTLEAWTGGPPTLELPGAGKTCRCGLGYKAPGGKVEGKTFTCKHGSARAEVGMLAVSFKAASEVETKTIAQARVTGAGGATAPSMKVATPSAIVTGAGRASAPSMKVALATAKVTGAGLTTASASKLALVTARVTGAGKATVTIAAPTETKVVTALVHGAGQATVTALGVRLATALVHGGGAASAVTRKVAVAVGRVTGGGAVTVRASRVASTTAKVSGGGLARATVSRTAIITALVHGGGAVTVTLRAPSIVARVTGGGGATVVVSYFVPEAHFPIKAPIPGHVAVSQRGRLNRNKGHLAIPNAGRSGT